MFAHIIANRIATAYRLLEIIGAPPFDEWLTGYKRYLSGSLAFPDSMLLIHPLWYEASQINAIQGARRFGDTAARPMERCNARLIWGCDCGLVGPVQYDHLYQYSLGGPTIAGNRIPLCSIHNSVKGADVHLFPWELGEPAWLAVHLGRINERVVG